MLVGRADEQRAVRDALSARGHLVIVAGEAGSGKTALLRWAAGAAADLGMAVLRGAAPPSGCVPWAVIAQAIRSWTRGHEPPSEGLSAFAPGLHAVLPEWEGADVAAAPPDQLRLLAAEGTLRLLLAIAKPAGAALLLDDLHLADPETRELLHHAAPALDSSLLTIVAAARIPEGDAVVRDLVRAGASALELGSLTTAQVAELASHVLGAPVDDGLAARVAAASGGVPLFVEEVVRAVRAAPDETIPLPRGMEQLVREQRRGLDGDGQRVLEAASVLRRLDARLLGLTTGLTSAGLTGALRSCVEAGLVVVESGQPAFRHALVAEAVLASMLPTERARWHAACAGALAEADGDVRERAVHLSEAGRGDDAARLLLEASSRTLRRAPASAEAMLREALVLGLDLTTRLAVRDALAATLATLGRWDEALALDRDSVTLAPAQDASRTTRMAMSAVHAGRPGEAEALIRRADAEGAPAAPLGALEGLAALWRGDLEEAIACAGSALGDATDAETLCTSLDVIGRASAAAGRNGDAVAAFRRWIDEAAAAGLEASRLQAMMELGNVEFLSGRGPGTLRAARALARGAGAVVTLVLADLSLAWCAGMAGGFAESLEAAEEAADVCRRLGLPLLPHALQALGWVHGATVLGSGDALLAEAFSLAPDDHDIALQHLGIRGELALRAGRYDIAAGLLGEELDAVLAAPASAVPEVGPLMLPLALLGAGRPEDAARVLGRLRPLPLSRVSVFPAFVDASDAALRGDEAAFESALEPMRGSAAYYRGVLLTAGADVVNGERAASWLRDALEVFEPAGMESDAARVRRLLRERGARAAPARRSDPRIPEDLRRHGVTAREAEVLGHVSRGASNREIAEALFLGVRTVETHVSSLLAKLGTPTRGALAALGARLLSSDGPS